MAPLRMLMPVWVIGSFAAGAALADGNQLLAACQQAERELNGERTTSAVSAAYCVGIAEAVRDTMREYNDSLPQQARICFPNGGPSNAQAVRVVLQYLRNTPGKLHLSSTQVTMLAYFSAFECK